MISLPVVNLAPKFSKGNSKLGQDGSILAFSIPAVFTCPGATNACVQHCYATSGYFCFESTKQALQKNLDATRDTDFVKKAIRAIKSSDCSAVRIHVAGDFYSREYIRDWYKIIKACKEKTFWAYTRSWRVPKLRVHRLARLENLRLWYSCDKDSPIPKQVPKGVQIAYMQSTPEEEIPAGADLVFRVETATVVKKIGGVQVCPAENGIAYEPDMTCTRCRICFE